MYTDKLTRQNSIRMFIHPVGVQYTLQQRMILYSLRTVRGRQFYGVLLQLDLSEPQLHSNPSGPAIRGSKWPPRNVASSRVEHHLGPSRLIRLRTLAGHLCRTAARALELVHGRHELLSCSAAGMAMALWVHSSESAWMCRGMQDRMAEDFETSSLHSLEVVLHGRAVRRIAWHRIAWHCIARKFDFILIKRAWQPCMYAIPRSQPPL